MRDPPNAGREALAASFDLEPIGAKLVRASARGFQNGRRSWQGLRHGLSKDFNGGDSGTKEEEKEGEAKRRPFRIFI